MRNIPSLSRAAALGAGMALLTFTACGGGGSDEAAPGGLGLLITDAPADGLSMLAVDLTDLQLRHADGSLTANLLAAPRRVELLSLAGTRSLLGLVNPPPGVYTGLRLVIDPATLLAYDQAGVEVGVTVTRTADEASFRALDASDLTLGASFQDVLVDVNVQKSLSADPARPGSLLFELEVEAEHEFEDSGMDEFRGRVLSEDPAGRRFTASLLDDSGRVSFGQVTVEVDSADALFGDDRQRFADPAAFFAALQAGAEVEVHGAFGASGIVQATRVEIEDSLSFPVKIKGDVLAVDAGAQTISFLWKEVRRGSALVYPVLAQAGNPRVLELAWDLSTVFTIEDGGAASAAQLVPGTEIYAHFLDFGAPMPFLAAGIEFDEDGAEFEGTILDAGGLPASFLLQVDADEPSWLSGAVTGPVTVSLNGVGRIWLDTATEPALRAADLLAGLKVEVHGALFGPPGSATLDAVKVKVKPGRLEGVLSAVNPGAGTVSLTITDLDDPFGGAPPAGAITAAVPPDAQLEGENGRLTLAGLADLLAGLPAGASVELKIGGVSAASGTILVWELEARIRD